MRGYHQFSFGILSIPVLVGTTQRKPEYLEMRRTAFPKQWLVSNKNRNQNLLQTPM